MSEFIINLNAVVGEFNKEDLGKYNTLNNIKLKFNATVMEYIGEFDLIINKFMYKTFNILIPIYRKVQRIKNKSKR